MNERDKQSTIDYFVASIKHSLILLHQGIVVPALFRLGICSAVADDLDMSDLMNEVDGIYNVLYDGGIEESVKSLESLLEQLQSSNSLS